MQRRQFTQASLAGALLCATAQHAWALSLGDLTNADASSGLKAALAQGVLGHDAEGAVKFSEADLHALLAPLSEPANNPLGLPGEDALRWGGTGQRRTRPMQPPEV